MPSGRPARAASRHWVQSSIEPLESRIAPATLVSPTQITYLDKSGDIATVTISKPLFTAANVNKLFTFDTGTVNGDNSAQQQLELFNLTPLGSAAAGLGITIAATGAVNVGYINASGINLGVVSVGGDLGRIHAGKATPAVPAIQSLTVGSLGVEGISTQAPGGNLQTLIAGTLPILTVNGDINQASIGVGGGPLAVVGALTVTGTIQGGALPYSGSIRTQGGIDTAIIGGIVGGSGASSGIIGTAGRIVSITVQGNVQGGAGAFSGAILATGAIQYVEIDGDILGGSGVDSGQIGSANIIDTAVLKASVEGGNGKLSGVVLARELIDSVTVTNGLVGGAGVSSGQIGSGGGIGNVTIGTYGLPQPGIVRITPLDGTYQGLEAGSGADSGTIVAGGSISTVTIGGNLYGNYSILEEGDFRHALAFHPGFVSGVIGDGNGAGVISAGNGITAVNVTGSVDDGGIVAANIGMVAIGGTLTDESGIHARGSITSVNVNVSSFIYASGSDEGIFDSAILADKGSIGSIYAGGVNASAIDSSEIAAGGNIGLIQAQGQGIYGAGIAYSDIYAGSIQTILASSVSDSAIDYSTFTVTHGIGSITASSYASEDYSGYGIVNSTFNAGGGIGTNGGINATSYSADAAISASGFDAGGNIGNITATEGISGSLFVAGINLGGAFAVSSTGTFNNTVATAIGYPAASHAAPASIGSITITEGFGGSGSIQDSTFLAGVRGPGVDKAFGTKDDLVSVGSTIGSISAPDGLSTDFFESGSIGATTAGAVVSTTYLATDSAVAAAGIGAITVNVQFPTFNYGIVPAFKPAVSAGVTDGIYLSNFISNAGIGNISVTLSGDRAGTDNSGIASSSFLAGHAIGSITITNGATGGVGTAYGITGATFNAGYGGYGGVGDINVYMNDADESDVNLQAGIYQTNIDASVCACMSANMGSIYVQNLDSGYNALGIADSVFRVHGDIGNISATMASAYGTGIEGSVFSAFGSIGDITVYGTVSNDSNGPSQFLAGYDIGTGMTFGGQNLGAKSLALHAGQSVGNVSVSGYFEGSDIIASINPGAGYVFGAAANTNVGAGGSVGFVVIGSAVESDGSPFVYDGPRSHAIEAANFAVTDGGSQIVTAFGYNANVPVVLYVDGGSGDVRISNLTAAGG